MMEFDAKDLDPEELKGKARREAELIYAKSQTRSWNEVYAQCMRGQAAEMYLINAHGYGDDKREYCDVRDPEGRPVEVKCTATSAYVSFVLEKAEERKISMGPGYASRLCIFINDPKTTLFQLHGFYDWDSKNKQFVQE